VLEFTLFLAAMVWAATANAIAGRAAAGIAGRLGLTYGQMLLESLFLLFLVVIGYQAMDWTARRGGASSSAMMLPKRQTSWREWGSGFALGWGMCLAAVAPVLLLGDFHARLNRGVGVVPGIAAAVCTLLVLTLAEEVIFRGYPFQRLAQAIGPAWATTGMSVLFGVVLVSLNPPVNLGLAFVDGTLFGIVLAVAYLRTHALWLGWGLHFGYRVVMAVLLGLPIAGRNDFGSLLDGNASGPVWLGGGFYGLDSTVWAAVVMLVGLAVLYRLTRDWAWAYTLPVIVPGGYEVVVAPPAAHVAMEKAAAPPPLVQILPSTPQSFSAAPVPEVHKDAAIAKD
jgi:membrane protease YdiL (CAAX protease family)